MVIQTLQGGDEPGAADPPGESVNGTLQTHEEAAVVLTMMNKTQL